VQPGDNVYRDAVVRIAELAGEHGVLDGFVFEGCDLKGPAVLVPQGSTFANTNLGAGDPDTLLWEIPPDRPRVIGAILARNCTFEGCTFVNVGFAGPPEFVQQMRQSLGSP
jgi:hypothetical protein